MTSFHKTYLLETTIDHVLVDDELTDLIIQGVYVITNFCFQFVIKLTHSYTLFSYCKVVIRMCVLI